MRKLWVLGCLILPLACTSGSRSSGNPSGGRTGGKLDRRQRGDGDRRRGRRDGNRRRFPRGNDGGGRRGRRGAARREGRRGRGGWRRQHRHRWRPRHQRSGAGTQQPSEPRRALRAADIEHEAAGEDGRRCDLRCDLHRRGDREPRSICANGPGGTGIFVVATTGNDVYAFDETTGAMVWTRNLGTPGLEVGRDRLRREQPARRHLDARDRRRDRHALPGRRNRRRERHHLAFRVGL